MAECPVVRWRSPRSVLLPEDSFRLICREAAGAFPAEACGLLIGQGARIDRVLPVVNQAADPDRFEIAPSDLFTAHRQARAEGLAVTGHYHSHPNGLAGPSQRDAEAIADLSAWWLIVAVAPDTGQVTGVSAWHPSVPPAAAGYGGADHRVDYQGNRGFQPVSLLIVRGLKPAGIKKEKGL